MSVGKKSLGRGTSWILRESLFYMPGLMDTEINGIGPALEGLTFRWEVQPCEQ